MSETRDGRERHREDVGGTEAVGPGDEADTAGVALAPGIETLKTKSPLSFGSGLGWFRSWWHYRAPPLPIEGVCVLIGSRVFV